MRKSELFEALYAVYGDAYGSSLASDLSLTVLKGRTLLEALDDGEKVDDVWSAFCAEMDADDSVRWYHRSTHVGSTRRN